jgi:2-succinyl-5-enolpyruvyl-6-hydroxy-3-cyclohexene-1-carboxylate synthase
MAKYPKKLIIAGHLLPDHNLLQSLSSFLGSSQIPVLTDLNSNLQSVENAVKHFDMFLGMNEPLDKKLVPDMIISFGNEFLSKRLKKFIRTNKPKVHIQLRDKEVIVDTFQSITHTIHISPALFFQELIDITKSLGHADFFSLWKDLDKKMHASLSPFVQNNGFGELEAVYKVINNLPKGSILHTSNSLPVRLASIVSSSETLNYCNRGTSGIDGCTSTTVGSAFESKELVLLITGDVAFFYDRNGLWHNYLPGNLRILLLNNSGGNIFRTLDGAKDQPELDQYFVTNQKLNAKSTAAEFEIEYLSATSSKELETGISPFLKVDGKAKLFEIHTDGKETAEILIKLRQNFTQILSA